MRNSSDPETMTSALVVTPTERQNSVARESSVRFWVGSFKSGGVSMTSSLVFLSTCFFRKRWNSPCRSTFWRRLSRAFSASVTRMKGAGVAGLFGDRLLEPERGFAPESLARDLGTESDLRLGPIGPRVGGAAEGGQAARCDDNEADHPSGAATHSHAPTRLPGPLL